MNEFLIGELCTFARGASVPRSRMHDSGEYLYLHYGDLYKGHELVVDIEKPDTPIPYISQEERIRANQFISDRDIILVLTSETVDDLGKALLVCNPSNKTIVAGTETTIMRVIKKDILLPEYLNYYVQTHMFRKTLQQYVTGMKVFRVHPRDISRIPIKIPNLITQRTTIKILDQITKLIKLNDRINDYLADPSSNPKSKLSSFGKQPRSTHSKISACNNFAESETQGSEGCFPS